MLKRFIPGPSSHLREIKNFSKRDTQSDRFALILLFSTVCVGTGFMAQRLYSKYIRKHGETFRWPKTRGRIQSVHQQRRRDGGQQPGRVRYRFQVLGASFESERIAYKYFASPLDTSESIVHYSPGQLVDVYFNPKQPEECVLVTNLANQIVQPVAQQQEHVRRKWGERARTRRDATVTATVDRDAAAAAAGEIIGDTQKRDRRHGVHMPDVIGCTLLGGVSGVSGLLVAHQLVLLIRPLLR